jgi:hypothetical protein
MGTLELTLLRMTEGETATSRAISVPSKIIPGIIKDYLEKKRPVRTVAESKRRNLLVYGGIGGGALLTGLGKYWVSSKTNGQEFDLNDYAGAFAAALYALIGSDAMGVVSETYRDGLDLERKENSRSLFPENMDKKLKKRITLTVGTATLSTIYSFYYLTR